MRQFLAIVLITVAITATVFVVTQTPVAAEPPPITLTYEGNYSPGYMGEGDVILANGQAYLAAGNLNQLQIISLLETLTKTGSAASSSTAKSIGVYGDYIYLGTQSNGVQVFNNTPPNPTWVRDLATGIVFDIATSNDLVFVASEYGLVIIDPITNIITGTYSTGGFGGTGITISGTVAFLSTYNALVTIDVDDPQSPIFISSFPYVNGYAKSVRFGNYLYAGRRLTSYFHTLDIADPANITKPSSTAGYVSDLGVIYNSYHDLAYLVVAGTNLRVFDINSTPEDPELVFTMPLSGTATALGVDDNGNIAVVEASQVQFFALHFDEPPPPTPTEEPPPPPTPTEEPVLITHTISLPLIIRSN